MASKIVVTGGNGQLGNCLRDIATKYPKYSFIFTDVEELDITKESDVAKFFAETKPNWVINAAAYTAVDKAETDVELARLLNATAVGILARESAKVGAALVQISTDYVFDGQSQTLLSEEMSTNPQGVYGVTKLEGEKAVINENPKHIILRTSWLYSKYGNNFVKTMRRLGGEKKEINVVADQWGSPTLADDLAEAIMIAIIKADSGADVFGLYHFSNEGATCWADFAQQIMEVSELDCNVNYVTTDQYPSVAKRPAFSVMNKNKFKTTFNVTIPEWEDALKVLITKLQ